MARTGSVLDVPLIIVAVFGLGIAVLIGTVILNEIQDSTTDSEIDQDTLQDAEDALGIFDQGLIAVNVFLFIVAIAFSFRIRTSPIFLLPAMLFWIITIWLSAEISDIFLDIAGVNALTSTANQYPNMIALFENWPVVFGVFGGLILVALYAKSRGTATGGGVSV